MDNKLSLHLCLFSESESPKLLTIYNTLKTFEYCSISRINKYKDLSDINPQVIFITSANNLEETINSYYRVQNKFEQYVPIILISLTTNETLRDLEELMYMPLSYTGIQDVIPFNDFIETHNKTGIIKTIIRSLYRGNYINHLIKK
jgi:transposase-like protein